MALAEDPLPHPHEDPLLRFLDDFTQPAPDHQLDAADFLKAYRGHLLEAGTPPLPNQAAYARLRLNGHIVTRGAQNRQWIRQRSLRPHRLPEYVRLQGLADTPQPPPPPLEPLHDPHIQRDLRIDLMQFGRETLARFYGKAVETLAEGLDDPDSKVRQHAALAIIRSFVPPAKPRDEDPAIDTFAQESRPSLADIETVIRRRAEVKAPVSGEPQGQR